MNFAGSKSKTRGRSKIINDKLQEERKDWLEKQTGVVMSSDAFLPFRDNIDCAKQVYRYGKSHVYQKFAVRGEICGSPRWIRER